MLRPTFRETYVEEHSNTQRTLLFNGKELDEETGLYYYGTRYYDAKTGVWLAVNPLEDSTADWTSYRFLFNNPLKYQDPDERFEVDEKTAKDHPELVKYLKGLKNEFLKKSDIFRKAFYETIGLNERNIRNVNMRKRT